MKRKIFAAALLLFATSAFASYSIFLKLGDIKGESTDADHKGWIELSSFSQSPTHIKNEVTMTARMGPWTAAVTNAMATGRAFKEVIADVGPVRYTFTNAIVSDYVDASHSPTGVQTTLKLAYGGVTVAALPRPNATPAVPPLATATLVNPNLQPAPINAQVFVDGVPSDRFKLLSFDRRGNIGVLTLRNLQGNGYFAANKKKNTKVNVKASAGQFLEMQMTDCTISSYVTHADGTATATFTFASYTGPVTVRP